MNNNTTTNKMLTADEIATLFSLVVRADKELFNKYVEEELGFVDIPDVNDDDDIYI